MTLPDRYRRPHLKQALRAHQPANLIYLNNPKAGCSTVKAAIWREIDGSERHEIKKLHEIEGSPFDNYITNLDWAGSAFIFSFTRNPFRRVVSGYLDKIVGRTKQLGGLQRRHAIPEDHALSFDEFVELITGGDPWVDPHWRPQYLNMLHPMIEPNFIGALERIDEQLPRVLAHIFGKEPPTPEHLNKTKVKRVASHGDMLTSARTVDAIRRFYAKDFELFGYSTDPDSDLPPPDRPFSDHAHPGLIARVERALARNG